MLRKVGRLGDRGVDVHKPKPWHGGREFLKEYGIIVLGVLTALAAEQVVEAMRWRAEVAAERQALRREVRDNLAVVAYRISERPCIDRRLGEVAEVFRRQARGAPLGLAAPFTRPPVWGATTGSWDIALAGQALGHMPLKEKLAFSNAFSGYRKFAQLREQEDEIWRRLGTLSHPDLLAAADWPILHQAYGEALAINERLQDHAGYVLDEATLGERPSKLTLTAADTAAIRAFCAPLIGP
jgi:hypothetical protein